MIFSADVILIKPITLIINKYIIDFVCWYTYYYFIVIRNYLLHNVEDIRIYDDTDNRYYTNTLSSLIYI